MDILSSPLGLGPTDSLLKGKGLLPHSLSADNLPTLRNSLTKGLPKLEVITEVDPSKDIAKKKKSKSKDKSRRSKSKSRTSQDLKSGRDSTSPPPESEEEVESATAAASTVTGLEPPPQAAMRADDAEENPVGFREGEQVEARYKGGGTFYKGTIRAVLTMPTRTLYDISYEDGDAESGVKRLRIRRSGENMPPTLRVGMKCEARHSGGARCYDGVVEAVNDNNNNSSSGQAATYAVRYDDGDYEAVVDRELIFVACVPVEEEEATTATVEPSLAPDGASGGTTSRQSSTAADEINPKSKNNEEEEKAPLAEWGNNTATPLTPTEQGSSQEGGEDPTSSELESAKAFFSSDMEASFIDESTSSSASAAAAGAVADARGGVGDGGDVISAGKGLDDTVTVAATQKVAEAAVAVAAIDTNTTTAAATDTTPTGSSSSSAGSSNSSSSSSSVLAVGEAVEARYGGGGAFYKGKISAVHVGVAPSVTTTGISATYDVSYDDGDAESGVKRLRIRRSGEKAPRVLSVGMKCEARHGGGVKCYDGVVEAVNNSDSNNDNGGSSSGQATTYAVRYDDGDYEAVVDRELIFVQCITAATVSHRRRSSGGGGSSKSRDRAAAAAAGGTATGAASADGEAAAMTRELKVNEDKNVSAAESNKDKGENATPLSVVGFSNEENGKKNKEVVVNDAPQANAKSREQPSPPPSPTSGVTSGGSLSEATMVSPSSSTFSPVVDPASSSSSLAAVAADDDQKVSPSSTLSSLASTTEAGKVSVVAPVPIHVPVVAAAAAAAVAAATEQIPTTNTATATTAVVASITNTATPAAAAPSVKLPSEEALMAHMVKLSVKELWGDASNAAAVSVSAAAAAANPVRGEEQKQKADRIRQLVLESLVAPLPQGWTVLKLAGSEDIRSEEPPPSQPSFRLVYRNSYTGVELNEHPLDDHFRAKIQAYCKEAQQRDGSKEAVRVAHPAASDPAAAVASRPTVAGAFAVVRPKSTKEDKDTDKKGEETGEAAFISVERTKAASAEARAVAAEKQAVELVARVVALEEETASLRRELAGVGGLVETLERTAALQRDLIASRSPPSTPLKSSSSSSLSSSSSSAGKAQGATTTTTASAQALGRQKRSFFGRVFLRQGATVSPEE